MRQEAVIEDDRGWGFAPSIGGGLGLLPLPPNSGLPEFGTLNLRKSDKSDFGGEREQIDIVARSSTLIAKLLRARVHELANDHLGAVLNHSVSRTAAAARPRQSLKKR